MWLIKLNFFAHKRCYGLLNITNNYYQNPMELPPSTGNTTPVIYFAASDERNKAASPMSDGLPNSPIGVLPKALFFLSGSLFKALADISVAIKPGAMQFVRM